MGLPRWAVPETACMRHGSILRGQRGVSVVPGLPCLLCWCEQHNLKESNEPASIIVMTATEPLTARYFNGFVCGWEDADGSSGEEPQWLEVDPPTLPSGPAG